MGLEDDTPTGDISGIDADALLAEVEGGEGPGGREIPMTREEQAPAGGKTAAQTIAELEFTYGDKPIKVPFSDPRVKQWASQGYDYAQKMAAFKQEREAWDGERSKFEKSYSPYKQIDEYAKQNPEWWKHVEASYQNRSAQPGQQPGAQAKFELPPEVKAELDSLKQFKTEFETKEAAKERAAEDGQLDTEVKSIREQFKDLDWNSRDEQGHSLEQRIMKHAIDNGIKSFKTAFRDYAHDHLQKLYEDRGKQNATKDLQKRTKLGLLGESQAPKKGIQSAEGIRGKSYEALLAEAKEELGIA